MQQKLIISIIAIIILAMGISSCNGNKQKTNTNNLPNTQTAQTSKTATVPKLTGLDNIDYSIKTLPDDIVTYLKTQSDYKEHYSKKLAIYYIGADCPYAQAFITTIEPLKNDPTYSEQFNFYPEQASGMKTYSTMEEAQTAINFSNTCQEFCIINTETNQIFTINGIGDSEAAKLPEIFEQLKDW